MTAALAFTALGLGLRHGVDWDHIAAIADLSSTAETRRRGFMLSLLYAIGHALVVLALGAGAVVFGATIPDGLDTWMGRLVGITLVALGVWVVVELVRQRRAFRLRSRVAFLAGTGYLDAERHFGIYATLSGVVAVASIVVGIDVLPAI